MQSGRRVWRFTRLALHAVVGVILTIMLAGIGRMSFNTPFYQRLYQWWLRRVVRIIGGHLTLHGELAPAGTLLVANHISWLDIPLLGGITSARFLSKYEVRHWPVIGWLAVKAGTLFISRGQAGAATQASATLVQALKQGRSVLVFPEGTTTKGNDVRTFHARLFAAAFEANVPVQPMAIRYPDSDGLTNPVVPYVDNQSLLANMQALLAQPSIRMEVHFLPPISPEGMSRKAMAQACEQQIRQVVKQNVELTVEMTSDYVTV